MNIATRTIQLQTAHIEVTAKTDLVDRVVNADGHKVVTGTDLIDTLDIVVIKDGKAIARSNGLRWKDASNPWDAKSIAAGVAASIDKAGLDADNAARVQSAINDARAEVETADVADYRARRAAAQQADQESSERVARQRARIYRAMDA